jgi:hypothetical protein
MSSYWYETSLLSIERLPMMFAHSDMGTSWKVYNHFYQMALNKKFQAFDYGE